MNKMLISLFTVVSLLSGSSLAQEATTPAAPVPEVPAATDAPAADAATDAPATAAPVAASYYAFDGCSDYKQPKKRSGLEGGGQQTWILRRRKSGTHCLLRRGEMFTNGLSIRSRRKRRCSSSDMGGS